jgi:hypothetical protein
VWGISSSRWCAREDNAMLKLVAIGEAWKL